MAFEHIPRLVDYGTLELGEAVGMALDKAPVDALGEDQKLDHTIDKCDLAAGADREEIIHQFASERPVRQRFSCGADRLHDYNAGAGLLCASQVLQRERLISDDIGAEEHQ
jgi:hypothetical protein